jgi:regulatory protein
MPELNESELDSAMVVWQRKFGTIAQDEKEKGKQVRFMQSRGFSLDIIFKVMRQR